MRHLSATPHRCSEGRQPGSRKCAPFLVAAILLAAAWAWAQWAPIRRAPEFEVENISSGVNLLVASALPWFLQWAGVVALFLGASRLIRRLDRRSVLMGASVPLIMGLLWWTSLVVTFWSDDPLEAMVDVMGLMIREELGAESLAQGALYEVIGPLTAPLTLAGPATMTGWSFVWTGLSTAAVMAIWTVMARIMGPLNQGEKLSRGRWAWCGVLMLLWLLPVIIRAVTRVLEAI